MWRRPAVHDDPGEAKLARAAQAIGDDGGGRDGGGLAVHRQVELAAQHHELVDGGGTVDVGGDEEGALAGAAQEQRQLGGGRRLAGTLQADQHHHRGRRGGGGQAALAGAQQVQQLVVDDLDDLLPRGEALEDILADRALAHSCDEVAGDAQVHVRLEEDHAHLAQRLVHVALGEAAAAGDLLENAVQLLGQRLEHTQSV